MRGLSPAGSAEKRRDHAGAGRYPLADVLSLQAQLGDDLFSHMTGMIG